MAGYLGQSQPVAAGGNSVETEDIVDGAVTTDKLAPGDIAFGDNDKATFGASDDLQIYHDGTASWIKDTGTGNLALSTDGAQIWFGGSNGKTMISAVNNAEVSLWYDNAKKLATTSTGIDVSGSVTCEDINTSGELNLTAASNNYIDYTDALHIRAAGSSPAYEDSIYCAKDSQVEIKHNGSTKLATTSTGVDVTGSVTLTSDYSHKYKSANTGEIMYRYVLPISMAGDQSYEIRISGFGSGIAHVKAMASHWTGGYALIRESYLAMDSYAGMSDFNQVSTTSGTQGAWSFSRPASGATGYQTQLVINKSAGSYLGGMRGLIIIESQLNLYLTSIT